MTRAELHPPDAIDPANRIDAIGYCRSCETSGPLVTYALHLTNRGSGTTTTVPLGFCPQCSRRVETAQ